MKFAATMCLHYAYDPHPVLAHVDVEGIILVYADSDEEARSMVHEATQGAYAFLYPYETPEEQAKVDQYQRNVPFLVLGEEK